MVVDTDRILALLDQELKSFSPKIPHRLLIHPTPREGTFQLKKKIMSKPFSNTFLWIQGSMNP